jgi:cell wall arabinan synthesis protein/arabinosyltransferase-like concanavalin domain-containing protein/EmbC-like arabinotransferase in arabinogalactan biosynthesis
VGRARLVLAVGLLSALAALAFPFAPVRQPEVIYTWTPADGTAVALPLMPYQPVRLTATISCAAARAGGLLLSTVPPRPDPSALPLDGLRLVGTSAGVQITSAGVDLGTVALPPGDCTLALGSDARATVVTLGGSPVLSHTGDVRPDVAGIFTDLPDAPGTGTTATLSLTADTRFATTPSPLKIALAVGCLVALGVLFALLRSADRGRPRVRLLPRGWWRPRPVDAVVATLLGVWWVIGSGTVDDGYIAGIVRGRGDNGFVGNVYRWLNAPEAPFGWFYEPYDWWSTISAATPWMRLPSTLLGLLCWFLVSRLLLPHLGRVGRLRGTPWVAALAFGTWWVPLDLGLRPEPWVAVGTVLAFLAVERAVATRRVLPLAAALVMAGATAAVTPGGVMAAAPVLAAAVPLLRGLRARTDLHLRGVLRAAPLVAALVAAGAATLLLMAADQGAAALAEAVRVRGRIGGGLPWYQEFERYALLLTPGDVQGAIGRRAAVLATLLAVGGLAWVLAGRERSGVAAGPTRRLLVTLGLSAVAMMISPTKWTQHFGALAGLGTAVLTLGLVVFGRRALAAVRDPATARRRRIAGLAGATVVCGLVLAGQNMWPFVSGWYTPTFSTVLPQVRTVPLATIVLAAGGAVVIVLLAWSVWRRSAERSPAARPPAGIPAPATPVAVVLAVVLGLQVLSLARIATAHRDGYTPAADALATLRGDPCGLQSALQVETDPAAGVLAAAPQPAPVPGVVPAPAVAPAVPAEVDAGGTTLPGIAVAGTGATSWFTLDARQRAGTLPVVVTVTGTPRPGDVLNADFARGARVLATVPLAGAADGAPADRRLLAPPGADTVRLAVSAGTVAAGAGGSAVVSLPRAPVLTPMAQVLPRGTRALLDWPVAFVFPCLDPAPLPPGTASLPQWRVAPPADDPSAEITYTPGLGGPFAGPRLLVTQRRMPTYLRDDPVRDGVQLYRWDPVEPMRTLTPTVRDTTDAADAGHLRVPQLIEGG